MAISLLSRCGALQPARRSPTYCVLRPSSVFSVIFSYIPPPPRMRSCPDSTPPVPHPAQRLPFVLRIPPTATSFPFSHDTTSPCRHHPRTAAPRILAPFMCHRPAAGRGAQDLFRSYPRAALRSLPGSLCLRKKKKTSSLHQNAMVRHRDKLMDVLAQFRLTV